MLKRDNWTNDEVIKLLRELRLNPEDGNDRGWKHYATTHNIVVDQALILFYDMMADVATTAGAKALDTDTGRVVCVGPRLPQ